MAHFYGTLVGSSGEITRCGTRNSGLLAKVSGWSIGGVVSINNNRDTDTVEFSVTEGSNNSRYFTLPQIYLDSSGTWTSDNPLMRQLLSNEHY